MFHLSIRKRQHASFSPKKIIKIHYNKIHEEKCQDKLNFRNENRHAFSSMNKTGFTRRKSKYKFHVEKNKHPTSFTKKKLNYNKFIEDINQDTLNFLKK